MRNCSFVKRSNLRRFLNLKIQLVDVSWFDSFYNISFAIYKIFYFIIDYYPIERALL